ncbi:MULTISPECIES: peptide chain release factor H [unclassified Micromonospora]|uniref:peptide chain release factor H n=1 Tax=unclassified Micromonospora TaxID=2617518 RepID=UPI001C218BC3|nr:MULTISPECIES: peptide chain release factor H [unclassified Micromonospora]MBU8859844.1 peptide chain release factor H [Micromonospora sp. WMMB482]MDM4779365.1 peptide chain release factor H [Micromonospora sp. b486]
MTELLLSAGRGPAECAWALARLLSRLEGAAARRGLRTERVETVPGDRAGTYRSVLVRITGAGAEAFAAGWTGTLCWQAPSPYRTGHGRKNWYVTSRTCRTNVVVTPFHEADVEFVPCRTGGPGGQHRNKASTAVRATHRPSGRTVVVDTERHLHLNRRIAAELLRQRIAADDEAARRAGVDARWRIHDELVRGDPVRVERP